MKPRICFLFSLIFILFLQVSSFSQTETKTGHDTRMQWWREARFGMFIHWGLYSVPAGEWNGKTGYGEWIRTSAEIPLETYNRFAGQFNPVDFNADEWVKMARDAGMKYIVITSKHHDGFCMFVTKQTDFSILSTPFRRDPMKELAAACKKYGLTFCFYHSIMDWHHPDYLPRRNWEKDRSSQGADFRRYVDYLKAELKELLTNYGEIGVLWFDGEWENTWNENFGKEIYQYCRSLQPNLIINNRVGAGRMDMEGMTKEGMFGGDFGTPEQQIPATGLSGVDWETCMTMNDHWGYNKNDKNFKSTKELIQMLADIASKGGNYLLNVGPTSKGVLPSESIDRLKEIGQWMSVNGEAIHGTTASPFKSTEWGRCTKKEIPDGVRLYLHVFDWPKNGRLTVQGCLNEVTKGYLLADENKATLQIERKEDAIIISLPQAAPDPVNSVVVLNLKDKLDLTNPPEIITAFNIFVNPIEVTILSDRENVQIRYTDDGREPTIKSILYTKPFLVNKSSVISSRCFRNGKAVSSSSVKKVTKVIPSPPVSSIVIERSEATKQPSSNPEATKQRKSSTGAMPGIFFNYYEGNWDSIPDFSTENPIRTGPLNNINLSQAIQKEYYAFRFEGMVQIPADDIYAFYTHSDDGSNLYIDDKMVVNNDGLHGMKEVEGDVPLAKGYHKIRVEFLQKTGSADLKVSIRSGNLKKQLIPDGMLFR